MCNQMLSEASILNPHSEVIQLQRLCRYIRIINKMHGYWSSRKVES